MNCEPTNFASRLSTNAPVLPTNDQPEPDPPCSLRNHSIAGESIASDSLRGASRKSSACAVGGVSTTIVSHSPRAIEVVELRHRGVLLRAGERARDLRVDRIREDPLHRGRILRVALRRPRRTPPSDRASSRAARRVARARRCGRARGSTSWTWWPSAARPSEFASRFAGSIVRTSVRLPRRAAASASAAAVVVLPTPPEPTQTMMRRSSNTSTSVGTSPAADSMRRIEMRGRT